MRFDKATATSSVPLKLPTIQAIPPLAPSDAPARFNVKNQDANEAKHVFEKNASESYYSEWFHFPNVSEHTRARADTLLAGICILMSIDLALSLREMQQKITWVNAVCSVHV